jgi:hypothetical protein
MKISDTQLLILSSASQRADHAATLPANLKGSAAKKVVDRLLKEKLLQELRATEDMPVWRRGDDNQPYSLRITKAGLKAIEVEDTAEASDDSAAADAPDIAAADASARPFEDAEHCVSGPCAQIAPRSACHLLVPRDLVETLYHYSEGDRGIEIAPRNSETKPLHKQTEADCQKEA